jgi:hypothetical protein
MWFRIFARIASGPQRKAGAGSRRNFAVVRGHRGDLTSAASAGRADRRRTAPPLNSQPMSRSKCARMGPHVRARAVAIRRPSAHADEEKDVKPQDHRLRRRPVDRLSGRAPEQLAAAHERALEWRASWRDEPAGSNGNKTPRPPENEAKRRERFASQVARAEFGRFYWSDALGRRMQEEMERSHRLKQEGPSGRSAKEQKNRRRDDGTGR